MHIGVFDSGLGGLLLLRALTKRLPAYTYIYLGDTKRVPYGNRSQATVLEFTKEGVDELIRRKCSLVILACNTASAYALPVLQAFYRTTHPHVQLFGMIEPSVEALATGDFLRIGLLATQATVDSKAFLHPLTKACSRAKIFSKAAPLLVPLIEHQAVRFAHPILASYLAPLIKKRVDAILLGCTHYPHLKQLVRKMVGTSVRVFSQDEILPAAIQRVLLAHPELEYALAKDGQRLLLVTDITPFYRTLAKRWFGKETRLERVEIENPDNISRQELL